MGIKKNKKNTARRD